MGTLRPEIRNSPRSHSSEVGNWELNGHFRDFIVWAPNLLSLWPPLYLPWLCLSDYKISKRKSGRWSDQPRGTQLVCQWRVSNSRLLAPHLQCFVLFALLTLPQMWRHCILNDVLTSSVSSLGSGILSEQCLARGSMNICWMNEHSFTNFHTAFGHKVLWYIALRRCFWLIFVGIFK